MKLSDGTACRSCLVEQSAKLYAGARNQERRLEHGRPRVGKQPARWPDLRTGGTIRPGCVSEQSIEVV